MATIRVLVVDDDPMVLRVNGEYVKAVPGFQVVGSARTGAEAFRILREQRPDLVLLDIYMPEQDGLATLREIRRREIPADIILVSAADDVRSIQEAMRHGIVDYIIKPFPFERLQAALETYRTLRFKLDGSANLDQQELDSVLHGGARAPEILPKGLHEATMKQIWRLLEESEGPVTAAEAAELLGLARVTARRYLDHLVRVERARTEVQYGAVGRPQIRYRPA